MKKVLALILALVMACLLSPAARRRTMTPTRTTMLPRVIASRFWSPMPTTAGPAL